MECKLVRITGENRELFRECIPDVWYERLLRKDVAAVGALSPEAVGAVVTVVEEKDVRLISIYVKEPFRRKGIGTELIRSAKSMTGLAKKRALAVEYQYPSMRALEAFLFRCGFRMELEGNQIYSVPIKKIPGTGLLEKPAAVKEGKILPVSRLSEHVKAEWLYRFGHDLPIELDPRRSGGEFLPEDSMVFLLREEVLAFAVCSRLEEGVIYLASLYSDSRSVMALLPMLQKTVSNLAGKYTEETLCFSAATEAGKRLAEKVCRGQEDKIDIQTVRTGVWRREKEETELTMNQYDMENLMPRVNGLSYLLDELGLENDVLFSMEAFPAILAAAEGRSIRFTYIPAAPVEEERFVLNLVTELPMKEEGLFGTMMACEEFNAASLFAAAYCRPGGDQVVLRCAVPEPGGLPSPEELRYTIDLFLGSVEQFEREILNKETDKNMTEERKEPEK